MLTFAEVCERLRITPKTLRKIIHSGALKAMKAGTGQSSGWRITEDDLADYIERQTVAVR